MPFNLAPTAFDNLAISATKAIDTVVDNSSTTIPLVGNSAIMGDCIYTTGRASINFFYTQNRLARVFFCASAVCSLVGGVSSGLAIGASYTGVPIAGVTGVFTSRAFHRLGKYSLQIGNITAGNITSILNPNNNTNNTAIDAILNS